LGDGDADGDDDAEGDNGGDGDGCGDSDGKVVAAGDGEVCSVAVEPEQETISIAAHTASQRPIQE
jgi:hypothetical protein